MKKKSLRNLPTLTKDMIHALGNSIYGGWLTDNGLGKKILKSQSIIVYYYHLSYISHIRRLHTRARARTHTHTHTPLAAASSSGWLLWRTGKALSWPVPDFKKKLNKHRCLLRTFFQNVCYVCVCVCVCVCVWTCASARPLGGSPNLISCHT